MLYDIFNFAADGVLNDHNRVSRQYFDTVFSSIRFS